MARQRDRSPVFGPIEAKKGRSKPKSFISECENQRLSPDILALYKDSAPNVATWAEKNIPEGLTVFQIPKDHRKRMRTTNMLERQNKEIKRRTRVATLFPNEASLLRLVTAVLVELSEEWETSNMRYLVFEN